MAFTYFFRDLQILEAIRDHVTPYLISRMYIHIWDAGCAMGPEPYSLAIMLRENMGHMIFRNVRIHATDIEENHNFGEVIRKGVYPEDQLQRIPREIFSKYFQSCDVAGHYQVIEEIRNSISYQKHDLLSLVPIRKEMALILCKNVLLHFREIERINVLKMFYDALSDDGFLAMEQTQKMPFQLDGLFKRVVSNAQLFRKGRIPS